MMPFLYRCGSDSGLGRDSILESIWEEYRRDSAHLPAAPLVGSATAISAELP